MLIYMLCMPIKVVKTLAAIRVKHSILKINLIDKKQKKSIFYVKIKNSNV